MEVSAAGAEKIVVPHVFVQVWQTRKAKVLEKTSKDRTEALTKAVETACKEKFVLQLFDCTFDMFHRHLISNVRWCELNAGKTKTRFGSLSF